MLRRVKADKTDAYEAGIEQIETIPEDLQQNIAHAGGTGSITCTKIPELMADVPVASGKGSDRCGPADFLKQTWCGSQFYAQPDKTTGDSTGLPGTL